MPAPWKYSREEVSRFRNEAEADSYDKCSAECPIELRIFCDGTKCLLDKEWDRVQDEALASAKAEGLF